MSWPRFGTSTFVSRWIVATLAVSIVASFDGGWLVHWMSLDPARIWRGQLWRLVTWPLIERGPLSLVLTCVAIYKFAGELAVRWGDRRLRRFCVEIVLVAAALTCLVAAVAGAGHMQRVGGWAIGEALLIAWARQFPDRVLLVYGLLALRGRQLINLTIGVALLYALFFGPVFTAPELIACAAAAAYPRSWLRR